MPPSPIAERISRIKKGFLPPAVSTHAPNGILNSDPVSEGIATSRPTIAGVSSIASLNLIAVGPYRETAANPKKNPIVVPSRPLAGVPFSSGTDIGLEEVYGLTNQKEEILIYKN